MMASPSELSLECKPQSYSMLLKSFGGDHNNNSTDQASQKLEEYLSRLEEERLKIDAFKRELPLCMQLLTNAMEASRQQLQSFRVNQGARPVLEEFMPLKQTNLEGSDQKTANISDKANWMVSAQLWSPSGDANKHQSSSTLPKSEADNGFSVSSPKLALDTKQRNGGAFLPFAKEWNSVPNNSSIRPTPELALASCDREVDDKRCIETENGLSGSRSDNSSKGGNAMAGMAADSQAPITTTTTTTTNQTNRKARRCWSPDLHRRFVNALQMLGGSQVATPKQIRELMKVDGLTNDEVKSHLQKYRLHTRRPSPSPQAAGGPAPQLVVLGGIWMPPEYATAAAAAHGGTPTIYSAHPSTQVSSHYCSPTVPPDFYPQPVAPPQGHPQALHHPALHQHHHHQLHVYKTTSHTQTHSSPESDAQRAGDRSESIEDGKSDSSSWKGESGENGGERRKLAALRDDGEESNGSQITLKF